MIIEDAQLLAEAIESAAWIIFWGLLINGFFS